MRSNPSIPATAAPRIQQKNPVRQCEIVPWSEAGPGRGGWRLGEASLPRRSRVRKVQKSPTETFDAVIDDQNKRETSRAADQFGVNK